MKQEFLKRYQVWKASDTLQLIPNTIYLGHTIATRQNQKCHLITNLNLLAVDRNLRRSSKSRLLKTLERLQRSIIPQDKIQKITSHLIIMGKENISYQTCIASL